MRISHQSTDLAVLAEWGERLSRSRLDRNFTQAQLAAEAGVSKRTVERLEKGESVQLTSFVRILRALGLSDRFELLVPEPEASPIARLESKGKERQRASGTRDSGAPGGSGPWTWGE